MRVAFHFTIPPPPEPALDAVVQEALWLKRRFSGSLHYLYPVRRFNRFVPQALCGLRQLRQLRDLDRQVDVHHLYSGGLHDYPALRQLKKPVVYTLTTGLAPGRLPWTRARPKWPRQLVTPSEKDREILQRQGIDKVEHVAPAIDLERLTCTPLPQGRELFLLAGSAPWSRRQFRTKGFELLLAAAERLPNLRLVLLWRGVLTAEIKRRVSELRLENRVEIIDERVDVNQVLARVHAAVVLSETPRLVKAYPHSLLESLAAGKPIVVSRNLAIADLAERHGCGETVGRLALDELTDTLERLMTDYPRLQTAAEDLDMGAFSKERLLVDYARIYRRVTGGADARLQTDRS